MSFRLSLDCLLALLLFQLVVTAGALFTSTGRCEDRSVCSYLYQAEGTVFRAEKISLRADVDVFCAATGLSSGRLSKLYCIKLRNVKVDTNLPTDNGTTAEEEDSSGDTLRRVGIEGLFGKRFCFVQAVDGRVVNVSYPNSEMMEIANVKKGIASAFQANFKKELNRFEGDAGGLYMARYKYTSDGSAGSTSYMRNIASKDVRHLPGVPRDVKVIYNKREHYVYDNKVLKEATGVHSFFYNDERSKVEKMDADTAQKDAEFNDKISVSGRFTLKRQACKPQVAEESIDDDSEDIVEDDVLARLDDADADQERMSRLRRSMPSVPYALGKLHKNPKAHKLAGAIQELMSLETKHGPLPGHTPAVIQVASYLRRIMSSKKEEDVTMRKLVYSLLAPTGDAISQKVLMEAFDHLHREGGGDEKEALLTYLAFMKGATVKTVDKLFTMVTDNKDPVLLVLGSLAEFTSKQVQGEIVVKLKDRLTSTADNSTEDKAHILHSLGNTGSPLAMTVLLEYVAHGNRDVQEAAISGLRMFTSSKLVQDAFIDLLEESSDEEIVETITQTLISGIRDHTQHPETEGDSAQLSEAIVKAALKSKNVNLHHLVLQYLTEVDTGHSRYLMSVLLERAVSDPVYDYDNYNSSEKLRHRRGSRWDDSNPDFNIIASLGSRQRDVGVYPSHKAYIFARTFGVSRVNARFGAGVFAGYRESVCQYKVFGKAIAEGHAFGRTATAAHVEFLRERKNNNQVYQRIYVKIVGKVLKNEAGTVGLFCARRDIPLFQSNRVTLLDFQFNVYIVVLNLKFRIRVFANLRADVKLCACESNCVACASLVGDVTITPEADASASLIAVRGGLVVQGSFTYRIEPEICADVRSTRLLSAVYGSWPNNKIDLYAYYQTRNWRLKWGKRRRVDFLSTSWTLGSTGRHLIGGSGTASCHV